MILARASALSVHFVMALPGKLAVACRLGFRFSVALVLVNSAFTCRPRYFGIDHYNDALYIHEPKVLRLAHWVNSNTESHCSNCVQLVPPAASYLGEPPFWSLQKPRSPVLPTASGTAVTV